MKIFFNTPAFSSDSTLRYKVTVSTPVSSNLSLRSLTERGWLFFSKTFKSASRAEVDFKLFFLSKDLNFFIWSEFIVRIIPQFHYKCNYLTSANELH